MPDQRSVQQRRLLSIEEALQKVLEAAQPLPPRPVPLDAAIGHYLAEGVSADLDNPPFDKSLVDGYALRFDDVTEGHTRFHVVGTVTAGEVFSRRLERTEAVRIMTGAPLPPGADVVVMQENVTVAGDSIEIERKPEGRYQHVLRRGATIHAGDVILRRGTRLKPAHVGLLAECGAVEPLVFPRPRVAVLTTGDELVPPSSRPGPGAIRNTNAPMLVAAVQQQGCTASFVRHVRDDQEELASAIAEARDQSDVVLLTGGVSVGERDYVPEVLARLGATRVFHGVRMRPGKPLYFGLWEHPHRVYVFGLPGNPVSALVGFLLFVRPLIRVLAGALAGPPSHVPARLAESWTIRCERPTYWPAAIWYEQGGLLAKPLPWQGSPDLHTVSKSDGFIFLPEGEHRLQAGELVRCLTMD